MLGFLSLSLGVFNLLPIPVLDGGAIFILLLEAVLGFVGIKMLVAGVYEVPVLLSLAVIVTLLAASIVASVLLPPETGQTEAP